MRPVILLMYVVMALWLLVGAALRVLLSVVNGVRVDALPFIAGGLGLVALLVVLPVALAGARNRRAARSRRSDLGG